MIKKPLTLLAAFLLLLPFAPWQHSEISAETSDRLTDRALDHYQPSQLTEPFWVVLERIPAERKGGCRIEFETFEQLPAAATIALNEIASAWNNGQPDQALALCSKLPVDLMAIPPAIGISWLDKGEPSPNTELPLWYTDIRIGTRDSIDQLAFDIHRASNHLFAVLKNQEGTGHYWHVNISTDLGQNWSETYSWYGSYPMTISATVVVNHCYVAYGYLGDARIRRFAWSNGNSENFGDGSSYVTVFSVSSPDSVREVVLTSNQDSFNNRLYYLAITNLNALRCFWDDQDALSWSEVATGVFDASQGLDASYNYSYTNYFFFVSYLDISGNLKILGWLPALYLGESETGQ